MYSCGGVPCSRRRRRSIVSVVSVRPSVFLTGIGTVAGVGAPPFFREASVWKPETQRAFIRPQRTYRLLRLAKAPKRNLSACNCPGLMREILAQTEGS